MIRFHRSSELPMVSVDFERFLGSPHLTQSATTFLGSPIIREYTHSRPRPPSGSIPKFMVFLERPCSRFRSPLSLKLPCLPSSLLPFVVFFILLLLLRRGALGDKMKRSRGTDADGREDRSLIKHDCDHRKEESPSQSVDRDRPASPPFVVYHLFLPKMIFHQL